MVEKKEPALVVIAPEQEPVPVVIERNPAQTVIRGEGKTLAPTTTEEADRVTAGQRRINILWEMTQATIALIVTGVTVWVLASIAINFREVTSNQLIAAGQLNVMATLILASYFARTNHQRIGGVGDKTTDKYEGR